MRTPYQTLTFSHISTPNFSPFSKPHNREENPHPPPQLHTHTNQSVSIVIPLHTLFHNHVNQSDPHGPRARTSQRSRQTSSNRFRKSTPSSSTLPLVHLSLNKALFRLSQQLPLTHSLTYALKQVDWSSVAQNINYKTPKAARDKWYPLRDKLFGGAAESTNNSTSSSSNKKGGGGKDFATTPLRAKKRKFGKFFLFGKKG